MLCHLTHGTSDNCGPRVRLDSPGERFVGWAQAERNCAGGRFGSLSGFVGDGWYLAGLHEISCISAALGAGVASGVGCWPRGGSVGGQVPAPETREVPPKTAQVPSTWSGRC